MTLKLSGDGPVDGNGGADSGKNGTEPWLRKMWRMPPKENAGLAHDMESALSRPVAGSLTGTRPWSACQVCLDETSRRLTGDMRTPLRALFPGSPPDSDHGHERNGAAGPFMPFAHLSGWRRLKVADRRTVERHRPHE